MIMAKDDWVQPNWKALVRRSDLFYSALWG
jgi:hypothetical protein